MNEVNYKNLVIQMIEKLDTDDEKFLKQIYTIIKLHSEKERRR